MGCGCLALLFGSFFPRLVLILLWIFTTWVSRAFDSFIVPLLGLIFLPYTTLLYVIVYDPGTGVSVFGWFLVIFAFLIDLSHYFGGASSRRRGWAW